MIWYTIIYFIANKDIAMELKCDWSGEITCSLTKETLSGDMLDRVKYADYLTTYLKQYKNESYVFNLNSSWGSGKTYFIKRWANSLSKNHPVIYFNSWKFDHNNEPLILILSEVIKQLNELVSDPEHEELKNSLTKSVVGTVKQIAPTLSKGIFKKISGVNWDDLSEDKEQTESEKDSIKFGSDLVSVSTKALLNLHVEQQNSIEDLKDVINEILRKVLTKENIDTNKRWSPMYVFIDELDRCRPTFAIEVLEVIKHIFDIPKIIFVIATDTQQLQHSIKAVYGHDFDAEKYLMRFFNRSFSLPKPNLKDFLNQLPSIKIIKDRVIATSDLNLFIINEDCALNFITMIFEGFDLELRSADQIVERVSSILANHEEELGVIVLLVFECLRVKNQNSYDNFWTKRITNGGIGEYQTANFIQALSIDSDKRIDLPINEKLEETTYVKNSTSGKDVRTGTSMTVSSIISLLIVQVSPNKLTSHDHNYHLYSAYLIETINSSGDISRFKDYVELASNLT